MLLALPADGAEDRRHRHVPRRGAPLGRRASRTCSTATSTLHAMAWLLVGSIPGVLIGSQLSIKVPGARAAGRVRRSCSCSPGSRSSASRRRRSSIAVSLGLGALVLVVWSRRGPAARQRRRRRLSRPRHRIARAWPGCLSTAFCRGAARGNGGSVRAHRGREARAEPDLPDARRQGLLAELRLRAPTSAKIDFRLRKTRPADGLDRPRRRARRARSSPAARTRAAAVALEFDGIDDAGLTLPDGDYRPVVHLAREHRTIQLPNTIVLDTTPPDVHGSRTASTRTSRPDGDGRNDVFRDPLLG